jgi:hypothetical protein
MLQQIGLLSVNSLLDASLWTLTFLHSYNGFSRGVSNLVPHLIVSHFDSPYLRVVLTNGALPLFWLRTLSRILLKIKVLSNFVLAVWYLGMHLWIIARKRLLPARLYFPLPRPRTTPYSPGSNESASDPHP